MPGYALPGTPRCSRTRADHDVSGNSRATRPRQGLAQHRGRASTGGAVPDPSHPGLSWPLHHAKSGRPHRCAGGFAGNPSLGRRGAPAKADMVDSKRFNGVPTLSRPGSSGVDRSSISPFQGEDLGFKVRQDETPDWSTGSAANPGVPRMAAYTSCQSMTVPGRPAPVGA